MRSLWIMIGAALAVSSVLTANEIISPEPTDVVVQTAGDTSNRQAAFITNNGTAAAHQTGAATGVEPAPSIIRGVEVTTVEEGRFNATLPEVNEPPVTILATTTTTAPPVTAAPGTESERRGHKALDRLSYDWQTQLPGWKLIFKPGRSGVLGYTHVNTKTIEIFVRSSQSDSLLAHVVAHELGHAVDVTLNSGNDRTRWQQARGITSSPWWPGNGLSDFSTGAGDFAESFAAWQVGPANFRSNLASAPTVDEFDLMSELANG